MKGDICPNAKHHFDHQWFNIYIEKYNINTYQDFLIKFYRCLSFYAFLRISKFANLKKSDLKFSDDTNVLTINIQSSITD